MGVNPAAAEESRRSLRDGGAEGIVTSVSGRLRSHLGLEVVRDADRNQEGVGGPEEHSVAVEPVTGMGRRWQVTRRDRPAVRGPQLGSGEPEMAVAVVWENLLKWRHCQGDDTKAHCHSLEPAQPSLHEA